MTSVTPAVAANLTPGKLETVPGHSTPEEEEEEEEEEEFMRIHGYYRGTQGARCYTDGASLQPDESEGCSPVSAVGLVQLCTLRPPNPPTHSGPGPVLKGPVHPGPGPYKGQRAPCCHKGDTKSVFKSLKRGHQKRRQSLA